MDVDLSPTNYIQLEPYRFQTVHHYGNAKQKPALMIYMEQILYSYGLAYY